MSSHKLPPTSYMITGYNSKKEPNHLSDLCKYVERGAYASTWKKTWGKNSSELLDHLLRPEYHLGLDLITGELALRQINRFSPCFRQQ
jgi:hypothetical protein